MLALALLACSLTTGCHPRGFVRQRDKAADEKIDRAPRAESAALPSRYSFRVAPYIFVSDFEIPRDQPLFTELASLRDQVYKDLLLPPGTAEVRVYLFETRERYERYMKERYPDLDVRFPQ